MTTTMSNNVIQVVYNPRKIWQDELHPQINKHRFNVIVAHRRFGKTFGGVLHMILKAASCKKENPQYMYIAPQFNQAKLVSWLYFEQTLKNIPDIIINNKDSFFQLPPTFPEQGRGARIYIRGADNPESLRGPYWDGVLIDEYKDIKPVTWNEVILPALADRKGWAIIIGTFSGRDQLYSLYLRALNTSGWFAKVYKASETGVLDSTTLQQIKASMTDNAYRREFECDPDADVDDILITSSLVAQGISKVYRESDYSHAPVVFGIDIARFGDDRTVIFRRQGLQAFMPIIMSKEDNMAVVGRIMHEREFFKPDAIFVDAGRGEGVIDRLRELGVSVIEVPFGSKPMDGKKYLNKRAEMYDNIAAWLKTGGALPDLPQLSEELAMSRYSYDSAGRIKLVSKDVLKQLYGVSPDISDALALTMAFPIKKNNQAQERRRYILDRDKRR